MKFKKGNTGRKKGSPNKKKVIMDAFCLDIVTGGQEKFGRELNKLRGRSYVMSYVALLEYCVAKKSRVEIQDVTPPDDFDLKKLSTEELIHYKALQEKMKVDEDATPQD